MKGVGHGLALLVYREVITFDPVGLRSKWGWGMCDGVSLLAQRVPIPALRLGQS